MGDRRLERFATPFGANAIDIETGEEVVLDRGMLVDAALASMAFPGWTPPVARDGRLLVDAAFIDPVPSALLKTMGCHHVIGVNTLGQMMGGRLQRGLPRQAYDVWGRYVRMAAHEIGRVHGEVAADVLIAPSVGDTTMLSFGRADELIDAGRRAAEDRLPQIREVVATRVTTVAAAMGAVPA
jgi:NTE family protein